jgi:hypothetical protein
MGTGEIIGMSIFGFLVLCGLAAGIWQGARQREQVARYSTGRGFRVLPPGYAPLATLLEQAAPDSSWSTENAMLAELAPRAVYLFGYSVSSRHGRSKPWSGFAALAEHVASRIHAPLTISRRIPGLEVLVGEKVEAGGEEFRRAFTVTCADAGVAMVTMNTDIERVLLDHIAGPGFNLTVTIAGTAVLVQSHWAQTEQEWDYLISLTRRLRAAVR